MTSARLAGRRTVAIVMTALMCAGSAHASGPGEAAPWYLDQFGGSRADLARRYDGDLGVLMARAPKPLLYLDWRILHHQRVGKEAGLALSRPCCDAAPTRYGTPTSTSRWLEARKAVAGAPEAKPYLETSRPGPNYTSKPTCFDDAFDTATTTLQDRIKRFGAGAPAVKAWLLTQDAVFDACSLAEAVLPPPLAASPDWLRADRAYQEAAFALYQDRNDDAAVRFEAIAKDRTSPWRTTGVYLAARARVKEAIARPSPSATLAADMAVERLAKAPSDAFGRSRLVALKHVLDFRARPQALFKELEQALSRTEASPETAVAFRDLVDLAANGKGASEALDWIATLKPAPSAAEMQDINAGSQASQDAQTAAAEDRARLHALAHAIDRFNERHDIAWLIAALSLANRTDPQTQTLIRQAEGVSADDPAWLTAQFHIVRLTLTTADKGDLRRRLDGVLSKTTLTVGDRNLFQSLRMQLAATPAEFVKYALRTRVCFDSGEEATPDTIACVRDAWPTDSVQPYGIYDKDGRDGMVGLGEDARALIDRMPLDLRRDIGRDPRLADKLRLDIALTNFARAVDLQDNLAIDELSLALATLLPDMASEFRAIPKATPGADKRFAEFFVLAKIPGIKEDLINLTRPQGKVAEYQGYWSVWFIEAKGAPAKDASPPRLEAYQVGGYRGEAGRLEDSRTDLVCLGECGKGAALLVVPAFAASAMTKGAAERGYFHHPSIEYSDTGAVKPFAPPPPGAVCAWEEMLTYVTAHPKDPRAPEALYWLVHVGRFGGSHDHSGRRAFKLLHARYGSSPFAKQTKYFYD
eukprot:gene11741-11830_t